MRRGVLDWKEAGKPGREPFNSERSAVVHFGSPFRRDIYDDTYKAAAFLQHISGKNSVAPRNSVPKTLDSFNYSIAASGQAAANAPQAAMPPPRR
jgi:hypothetical protein